jgi:hypothetical protein
MSGQSGPIEAEDRDVRGFRWRAVLACVTAAAVTLGVVALAGGAVPASADGSTCTGTNEAPGVLAGTYTSGVTIEGTCIVNSGAAVVEGDVTLAPGAGLFATYAKNDLTGSGTSSLTVEGTVKVEKEGTLYLGCETGDYDCFDGTEGTSSSRVTGNLIAKDALGVVVHDSVIEGTIKQSGGGGGEKCEIQGAFAVADDVVYSAYDDSTIGNMRIRGVTSCWMGLARDHVARSLKLTDNHMLQDNAVQVLSSEFGGNLACKGNSAVWDNGDASEHGELYPRRPLPNTVRGTRSGQCVLSSPNEEGEAPGPGPF